MATDDPRDGRSKSGRPIIENVDKLATGMDATLTMLNAQLGEVIRTQQEGNALLEVLARSVSGQKTIGRGVGGVRPPMMANIGAKTVLAANAPSQAAALQPQAEMAETRTAGRRTYEPYTAGIDYTIETGGGSAPLGVQTRKGVRSGVANWLTGRANYLSNQYALHDGETLSAGGDVMGLNQGYTMDERGRYHHAAGTMNAAGKHIGGQLASASDAAGMVMSAEDRQGVFHKAAKANIAGRMGEAWGEGQPIGRALLAGLPQTALKVAGGAAAAVAVADQTWKFVQGQAAQQRTLQEAYGGSMGDNFGDRASQWVNRNLTGRFSLLGSENYDQLFQGAMDQGLRGAQRGQYISAGANLMGQGVNAQQTKQIMDMSVEAGLGLSGLASAIKEVNSAARDAGVNAKRAREIFIANYTAGNEIMFGSQGAKTFATQVTQGQLAQARPYQGINTVGTMTSPQITQMMASALNMSYGQFEAARQDSATGTIVATEQVIKQRIDSQRHGTAPVKTLVEKWIKEVNGGHYDATYDQVPLGKYLMQNGWDSYYLSQLLTSLNVDFGGNPELAPGYVGNLYTPESGAEVAKRSEAQRIIDFAPMTITNTKPAYLDTGGTEAGTAGFLLTGQREGTGGSAVQDDLSMAYLKGLAPGSRMSYEGTWDELKGKQIDPGVSKLIKDAGAIGLSESTIVRVMTTGEDGKPLAKFIPISEALRDFPDQVNSSAVFAGGVNEEYKGKSVSEITGAPVSTKTPASAAKVAYYGDTQEQWDAKEAKRKKEADTSASGGGKVEFVLSDEAKRILIPKLNDWYLNPSAPPSQAGP